MTPTVTNTTDRTAGAADSGPGVWQWRGAELRDAHDDIVAAVCADVLCIDDQRLLCESLKGRFRLRCRATAGNGEVFTVNQFGFTTARLGADCSGRRYKLTRGPLGGHRTIISTAGDIAVVAPNTDGSVTVTACAAADRVPLVDLVYLTWVCFLADGNAPTQCIGE